MFRVGAMRLIPGMNKFRVGEMRLIPGYEHVQSGCNETDTKV